MGDTSGRVVSYPAISGADGLAVKRSEDDPASKVPRRMSYQSRKRYTSRADKFKQHMKAYRLAFICAFLIFVVYLAFSWRELYDYFRTFFM